MLIANQSCRLVSVLTLTCILLVVLASIQAQAGLRGLMKEKKGSAKLGELKAELNEMADLALAKAKSELSQSDYDRIMLLETIILGMTPIAYRQEIRFTIDQDQLIEAVNRVTRLELGAYYLGRREVDQQLFEQTLADRLVSPCRQFDSIFNGWWQKANNVVEESEDQQRYNLLVGENVCRVLVESTTGEFNQLAWKGFGESLQRQINNLLQIRPNSLDRALGSVSMGQLDRLRFLYKCTAVKTNCRVDIAKRVDYTDLVIGLAFYAILDLTEPPSVVVDEITLEQKIEEYFAEPCKSIDLTETINDWNKVQKMCNTFVRMCSATGDFKELAKKVSQEMANQLQKNQLYPELYKIQRMSLVF